MILATGVAYRQLDVPGLADLTGRGVFYGSALTEAASCVNHDVYIVGAANSAGQAAVYLARGASSVTLLVRGSSLERSMSHYLVQQVAGIPAIRVRTCTEVAAAHGTDHLERLTLRDSKTGETRDGRRAVAVRLHRRGPADRLAGRRRAPGRSRVRPDRA